MIPETRTSRPVGIAFGDCAECLRLFALVLAARLSGDVPTVVELRAARDLHVLVFPPEIQAA